MHSTHGMSVGGEDNTDGTADAAIDALERAVARAAQQPVPAVAPAASSSTPPRKDPLEELAKLAEQLRPEAGPRWRPGPLGLALLGLFAVVAGTVALTRGAHGRPSAGRPLLPPPDLTSDAEPPWRAAPPPPGANPGPPTKPLTDARAIDLDLEREFGSGTGSGRPTIPGPAQPAVAPLPPWVKGVEVREATDAGTGPRKLGGRYGDHLRVQLRSSLDSRLCGSGAVEGVLVRPYVVNGAVVLPPRTLAFGQCSSRGDRFLLTFTRLRLPDGSEVQFEGVALDAADGKPGVLASRRIGADRQDNRESLGGEIARGAASTVLSAGTAPAGLPGQLANSAGQTAISARPSTVQTATEDALLLDSRPVVELFVAQGF